MSVLGAILVSIGGLFGIIGVNTAREDAQREEERRRQRSWEIFHSTPRLRPTSNVWHRPRTEVRSPNSGYTATLPTRGRASDASQTCISCQDDVPQEAMLLLQDEFLRPLNQAPTCNHVWCHECLKGRFEAVLKDRTLWPPACCNKVPFAEMEILALNLLDTDQYETFRAKSEEYEAKNPIYCPEKTCSAFIPVRTPFGDDMFGRGYLQGSSKDNSVTCKKCKTVVCTQCKQHWHPPSVACAKDEDRQKFDQLVEREMWASCPACNQTIELAHGCNHMVCICKKEFCYVCKRDWRGTCPCPPWGRLKQQRTTAQRTTTAALPTRPPRTPVEISLPITPPENLRNFFAENTRIDLARRRVEALRREREAGEERRMVEEESRRRAEREEESRRRIALANQAREEGLRRELQQRLAREREERERRERAQLEERERRAKEERKVELKEANRRRKAELIERHQALVKERLERTSSNLKEGSERARQASAARERDDALRREILLRIERERRQRELEQREQHERRLQEAYEERQKWKDERVGAIVKSIHESEQKHALAIAKQSTTETSDDSNPRRHRTVRMRNRERSQYLESDDTNPASAMCWHPNRRWPQVNGRNQCSRCRVWHNKFMLQCPECEILACVTCSRELKRGHQGMA